MRIGPDGYRWAGLLLTALAAGAGVWGYVRSDAHQLHDPDHALQQLDLLYLDQPAPGAEELGLAPGQAAVVVFCRTRCPLPELPQAQVVRSTDARLARRYALVTESGRIGPGYALIDARGQLRYRTFDPGLADHEQEIGILIDGLR
ncbi:hypothetical protein ABZ078_43285 [Streptomyces sp. NPDC006385]|uniref:hypothetical protein n=1 Tax=Streptomyces sp. NPDC006385 TaxID=3156761 RepID=UPI0033AE8876